MSEISLDSMNCRRVLEVGGQSYHYFSLPVAESVGAGLISKLPYSLKILLENMLRHEDGRAVTEADIRALASWAVSTPKAQEIAFRPARILMQDFTGVPAVCDLAAMRGAIEKAGLDPSIINPLSPVDLVIDHSVMVDNFGSHEAFQKNVELEMERNLERYRFLRWGQQAFKNFQVVPPGTGICHQVNLEYLAKTVWVAKVDGCAMAYPDTLVGTDSHTTMVNGLGVLGWGVGGIEAEAAMLGQPISMLIPEVVGVQLMGSLQEGVTATDLVLTIVEMLRQQGVVDKFVEFFGSGLDCLSLADRSTIANMAPEYGATCGFFPVDQETIAYLRLTGRDEQTCTLVEAYSKAQGLWRESGQESDQVFTTKLNLDLTTVKPSVAGPKRPQDKVLVSGLQEAFDNNLDMQGKADDKDAAAPVSGQDYSLQHGSVVIAAITSCTNTSNPAVMLSAGLVAANAVKLGLTVKPWVKTSLAPGSKVVTEYLEHSGLQTDLDTLGFNLVGYGCTTCIGNSGPLPVNVSAAIKAGDLVVSSVLSGNRNFESRVHQEVRANWLASPPLVVAYALAGTTRINLDQDALGADNNGNPVYLKDIWPSNDDVSAAVAKVTSGMFKSRYQDVYSGPEAWQAISPPDSHTYHWPLSTYIEQPPFFTESDDEQTLVIENAKILCLLADSVTTDHISPAGAIAQHSPAGKYLASFQVAPAAFNSYGSRRGSHEIMVRGTFANTRLRNEMVPGVEGGYTKDMTQGGEQTSIYEAAMNYKKERVPLVIVAGKEYGTGSSRDWAAKGTMLLGVKAVIVESFERIHRSNLVGMGVLPVQFKLGENRQNLALDGSEIISINLPEGEDVVPGQELQLIIKRADGGVTKTSVLSRLDTENEVDYFKSGGILHYVLNRLKEEAAA